MRQLVIALVVLAFVLMGGIGAIGESNANQQPIFQIDNEEFNPTDGTVTLENSNIEGADYSDTVTVRNKNGGVATPGDDYIWHESNGTLEIPTNSNLENDNVSFIDYSYTVQTQQREAVFQAFGGGVDVAVILIPVLGFAAMLGGMLLLARVGR